MVRHAYECEVECCNLSEGATTKQELLGILRTMDEQAPEVKRVGTTFKPVSDVKEVPFILSASMGGRCASAVTSFQNRKAHSSTSSAWKRTLLHGNPLT